jgi:hypothetical protein
MRRGYSKAGITSLFFMKFTMIKFLYRFVLLQELPFPAFSFLVKIIPKTAGKIKLIYHNFIE